MHLMLDNIKYQLKKKYVQKCSKNSKHNRYQEGPTYF